MKRWLTHLMIFVYVGALCVGLVCHTLEFGTTAHPGMYFLVWDMFRGWSAFATRTHVLGEGEDGNFYRLAPGPWGEFQPFGDIGRRHYDVLFNTSGRLAMNTLKHTQHGPMTRVFVVEECWPKKFNVPDRIWKRRYDEPKDVQKYYHVKSMFTPEGVQIANYPTWVAKQYALRVANNTRLLADWHRGREFYTVNPRSRDRGPVGSDKSTGSSLDAPARSPYRSNAD